MFCIALKVGSLKPPCRRKSPRASCMKNSIPKSNKNKGFRGPRGQGSGDQGPVELANPPVHGDTATCILVSMSESACTSFQVAAHSPVVRTVAYTFIEGMRVICTHWDVYGVSKHGNAPVRWAKFTCSSSNKVLVTYQPEYTCYILRIPLDENLRSERCVYSNRYRYLDACNQPGQL